MPTLGALRFPTFNPAMATITGVTKAVGCTVQTAFAHTFIIGQYVKFVIPPEYGMTQLNGLTGLIVFTSSALPTFFRTDIDTTQFDTFVVPVAPTQSAQAVPSGEVATQFYGANVNITASIPPYPPYPNPSPQP